MESKRRFSIVVVGAGPVGLTIALGLANSGHTVTVLERQSSLQITGGPVYVQPPAVKVLEKFNLGQALKQIKPAGPQIIWSYKESEAPLLVMGHDDSSVPLSTDRQTIQNLAYDGAVAAGAKVLFNKTVVKLKSDETPTVYTEDNDEYYADLIIGADGIKSKLRRLMFPDQDMDAIPSREVIFHSEIPIESLRKDARLNVMFELEGSCHFTFGPGRNQVSLIEELSPGKTAAYTVILDYGPPPADRNASWYTPAEPQELQELMSDFSPRDRAHLEHVTKCNVWRIGTAPMLSSWRSSNSRVLLVGDAAHAMVPHAAQGISQGIESAGALVQILDWARSNHNGDDLGKLVDCFERFRRPRVEKLAALSKENVKGRTLPDGPAQEARDAFFKKMGQMPPVDWSQIEMDGDAPSQTPQFRKWVTHYNVADEANKFMETCDLSIT